MDDLPLFLKWSEASKSTGWDERALKKMFKLGQFPQPVLATPGMQQLVTEEVIDWYQHTLADRRVTANG